MIHPLATSGRDGRQHGLDLGDSADFGIVLILNKFGNSKTSNTNFCSENKKEKI